MDVANGVVDRLVEEAERLRRELLNTSKEIERFCAELRSEVDVLRAETPGGDGEETGDGHDGT